MSKGCQKFYYASKVLGELVVATNRSQECYYLFNILGGFISLIAVILEGSGLMQVVLRI